MPVQCTNQGRKLRNTMPRRMQRCWSVLAAALVGGLLAGCEKGPQVKAVSAAAFVGSLGVDTHVQHGQDATKLVGPLQYLGVHAIRDGADAHYDMSALIALHNAAKVQIDLSPGSGVKDADFPAMLTASRQLAAAKALLSIEGPNEPNNFGGVTYDGVKGGGADSWLPVAKFQRDLYRAVKNDAVLKAYPVLNISESGAETDNVGLQFLKVPAASGTSMPEGTTFADYANCHNYVPYSGNKGLADNMAWDASDPVLYNTSWDGLVGNYGITWGKHYHGYDAPALETLPRITTETGWKTGPGDLTEEQQGRMYLNIYLGQFKHGWTRTFMYELIDDQDGGYGFFKDYTTPRKAAVYLHNLTAILADSGSPTRLKSLGYSIPTEPATVHDLLLQKSNGTFELVVWGEQTHGASHVDVVLGSTHSRVQVYDPTVSNTAQQSLTHVDTVPLTLSDHPVVLEFRPGGLLSAWQ